MFFRENFTPISGITKRPPVVPKPSRAPINANVSNPAQSHFNSQCGGCRQRLRHIGDLESERKCEDCQKWFCGNCVPGSLQTMAGNAAIHHCIQQCKSSRSRSSRPRSLSPKKTGNFALWTFFYELFFNIFKVFSINIFFYMFKHFSMNFLKIFFDLFL